MQTLKVKKNLRSRYPLLVMLGCSLVMGLASGCASGGYKLTRQYAGFVNKQNIIVRIVLYILTAVVFAVTLLVDAVIFNTMDFWNGRVSQGNYNFNQDGKLYAVQHKLNSATQLRETRIEISGKDIVGTQVLALRETASAEIEVFVDGVLKAKVDSITEVPSLSLYDAAGNKTETRVLWSEDVVAAR